LIWILRLLSLVGGVIQAVMACVAALLILWMYGVLIGLYLGVFLGLAWWIRARYFSWQYAWCGAGFLLGLGVSHVLRRPDPLPLAALGVIFAQHIGVCFSLARARLSLWWCLPMLLSLALLHYNPAHLPPITRLWFFAQWGLVTLIYLEVGAHEWTRNDSKLGESPLTRAPTAMTTLAALMAALFWRGRRL
jgi:hypothetical protein